MIIKNIQGMKNASLIGEYEEDIYMMKYNEVAIQAGSNLNYND
jgi:hypothetical protein